MLKEILPVDLIKHQSNQEWKKEIVRAYNQVHSSFLTVAYNEARVAFPIYKNYNNKFERHGA